MCCTAWQLQVRKHKGSARQLVHAHIHVLKLRRPHPVLTRHPFAVVSSVYHKRDEAMVSSRVIGTKTRLLVISPVLRFS
jgi:hypothetical protein